MKKVSDNLVDLVGARSVINRAIRSSSQKCTLKFNFGEYSIFTALNITATCVCGSTETRSSPISKDSETSGALCRPPIGPTGIVSRLLKK